MEGTLPYWIAFTVDYAVFGYVAVVCVLTAVLFGLAPALHVSKSNANEVLKEGGRGHTGGQRVRRFSHAMVVAELALSRSPSCCSLRPVSPCEASRRSMPPIWASTSMD
jgi:hypothetical protein